MIQTYFALLIVFLAVAYTLFSGIKLFTSKKKDGCGSGCSCGAKSEINNLLLKNSALNKNRKITGNNLKMNENRISTEKY